VKLKKILEAPKAVVSFTPHTIGLDEAASSAMGIQ